MPLSAKSTLLSRLEAAKAVLSNSEAKHRAELAKQAALLAKQEEDRLANQRAQLELLTVQAALADLKAADERDRLATLQARLDHGEVSRNFLEHCMSWSDKAKVLKEPGTVECARFYWERTLAIPAPDPNLWRLNLDGSAEVTFCGFPFVVHPGPPNEEPALWVTLNVPEDGTVSQLGQVEIKGPETLGDIFRSYAHLVQKVKDTVS